jgi:hypothetical protein
MSGDGRGIPKTRSVSGMALEKAAKGLLFSPNPGLFFQNLNLWGSLYSISNLFCRIGNWYGNGYAQ